MTETVATLYGETFDREAARTRPETFVRFFGIHRPADQSAAIAALHGHPPEEWPELIRPFAARLPAIPLTAPVMPLVGSGIERVAKLPPEARRLIVNAHDWHSRSVWLGKILQQQAERADGEDLAGWSAHFSAIGVQWTLCIEDLELEPITSLQAAVCYLATVHHEWNRAAIDWLEHVAGTWWPAWRERHPEIVPMLKLRREWGYASPVWLIGREYA